MSARLVRLAAASCVILCSRAASAQPVEPLRGRLEVAVGGQWLGPSALGSRNATLTTGAGATFNLFNTSSSFAGTGGFEVRLGIRVRPRLEVEAVGSYARPAIETAISNDFENAASTTASESVRQYVAGGGALWYLPNRLQKPRLRLFATGGVAFLRQLHEADTLAVNGVSVDVGAGLKYVLLSRRSGRLHGAGIRADARFQTSINGVAFESGMRHRPVVTASAFFRY